MARYGLRVLLRVPGVIVRAANSAVGIVGLLVLVVALFNRSLAREISNWDGFSPLWALLPFGVFLVYGLIGATYSEFSDMEKERDAAVTIRDTTIAQAEKHPASISYTSGAGGSAFGSGHAGGGGGLAHGPGSVAEGGRGGRPKSQVLRP